MSGPLLVSDMPGDVRVCVRCGTRIVTLAAAVRMIWADVMDDVIPAEVIEPVTDVWVDVLCSPSCPPGDHEPCRN